MKRRLTSRWESGAGKEVLQRVYSFFADCGKPNHARSARELTTILDGLPLRDEVPNGLDLRGIVAPLAVLAEHEKQMTAPAGDVIRQFLPADKPCLILIDELMNYVSRNRKTGMATQLYNFLHNLSEESRAQKNMLLAVSIPASELEMTADDQADYTRFKKLLDRLGKPVIMSAEAETSEIIRRRLLEGFLTMPRRRPASSLTG